LHDAVKVWEYQARSEISDVSVTKNGDLVVVGSSDGTLVMLDWGGNVLWTRETGAPILRVKVSYDGEFTAVTTSDSKVHLYDKGGNPLWKMGLKQPICGLSMNSTGSSVVIGSENMNTYVIDRSGKVLWGAKMGAPVGDVAISANGNYVAAGSDDHSIYLLDIGGRLVWSYRTEGPVQCVAISDNGDYIMASSMDKRLYFFDRSGSLIWNPRNTEPAVAIDLSLAARNMVIAVGHEVHLLTREGSLLKRWPAQEKVLDVAISHNGEFAAAASADDHVYFFDQNGEEIWRHKCGADATCVAMNGSGDIVAAGGRDRTVRYFDNNKFFESFMTGAHKALEAIRHFGVSAIEADVLMQRAQSEFHRKEFTSALNYARGAEKVAQRIKEKSRPEVSILAVSTESFNVDSPTRLNLVIMNTGSAHIREARLDFFGQAAIEGPAKLPGIASGKFLSEAYLVRPLAITSIPMKLCVSYCDMEGKEYLSEAAFSISGGEAGKKVAFGKNQPVIQFGNIQRLIAKVQASKKEAPPAAKPPPTAPSVPAPGPRHPAPGTFVPAARCPVCGQGVRREWPACPFCHAKCKTG
jgi:hypothetical protein